jgi:O-methyltransferase involved in polyketide biosynthesis
MNSINKTLYIPLYGKSFVSKKGLFLTDKKAEEIWQKENFTLKGKAKSKWLAYYMGIRSAVFDNFINNKLKNLNDAVVIHIGCGLDGRVERVNAKNNKWYDVDFLEVINERKKYYFESDNYKMLACDVRDNDWLAEIKENNSAIVVMEGVSMYLTTQEMQNLFDNLSAKFKNISLLVDCYTSFAVKMSKKQNPINSVGVNTVYGIDNPLSYQNESLIFEKEHEMTPKKFINELKGFEKFIFSKVYAGGLSKKLYMLFEYKK